MSDQDIFDNTATKQEEDNKEIRQETPATQDDPFADKLKVITNENGEPKYKDIDTALEALKNSQEFIQRLQTERRNDEKQLKELREQLEKMGNIEDFVNRVTPPAEPQGEPKTSDNPKELSEEKFSEMFQAMFNQRETADKKAKNYNEVVTKLKGKHGDQTRAVIQKRAAELGTTPAAIGEMAKNNPKLVLELFGETGSNVSSAPSQATISSNNTPTTELERPKVEPGQGIARGGKSDKELAEMWRKSASFTNKRLGIE